MRRKPAAHADDLPREVIDVLVHGWAHAPQVPEGVSYDALAPFLIPRDEWPRLWRTHQRRILAEAKRRGVAVPYAAEHFTDREGARWRR